MHTSCTLAYRIEALCRIRLDQVHPAIRGWGAAPQQIGTGGSSASRARAGCAMRVPD
jgi:hypothetical protein